VSAGLDRPAYIDSYEGVESQHEDTAPWYNTPGTYTRTEDEQLAKRQGQEPLAGRQAELAGSHTQPGYRASSYDMDFVRPATYGRKHMRASLMKDDSYGSYGAFDDTCECLLLAASSLSQSD